MELLGERPVWSMSGGEMLSTLDALDAALARLQTYRLRVIAGIEQIGYAKEIGAHDTARLLTFRHRIDSREAHRDVRLACALPRYDAVSAALPDTTPASACDAEVPADHLPDGAHAGGPVAGRPLSPGQAQAIVWALDRVAARVPADDLAVAEQQLVGLAAHLSPGQLRKAGKQIGDLLDADGPEPDEHKAYARESLTMASGENGVNFRGFLANENAELLRSLIHAGARPHKTVDGEPDPRTREKRQADALSAALTLAAASTDAGATLPGPSARLGASLPPTAGPASNATADTSRTAGAWPPGYGAKAHITVTIDFNDLKAATASAFGQVVYGDALSAAAIRRLACDAGVVPLVLGSNSEPLDVGRSERLVNRAMRRALNARDRGCVVCGAPPVNCDAHHIRSWIDGGPTALDNLVLLCRRHHIDLHAGHWTITITNGTVHVSRPTWADPPPHSTPFPNPPHSDRTPNAHPTQHPHAFRRRRAVGRRRLTG